MINKDNPILPFKHVFAAAVVVMGIIALWRGLWGLMDLYLFPDEAPLSFIVSIIIGLAILIFSHYSSRSVV